jgi:predicted nucleic acid-binding protein
VTLIDSNIFMYAGGSAHPHRKSSLRFLDEVIHGNVQGVIDAETLQEILHRYRSIQRWSDGEAIYDRARIIFPDVLAITSGVTDGARVFMQAGPNLTARDAVHAAVVKVYGLDSICSFDRDFDQISGLKRIEP